MDDVGVSSDALESRFLLYSNAKLGEVKGISLDLSSQATDESSVTYEVIEPITGLDRPVAVDYHKATQYIYYSDATSHRIGRRKVNGSGLDRDFITGNCIPIAA